jgi:hypothetical protein
MQDIARKRVLHVLFHLLQESDSFSIGKKEENQILLGDILCAEKYAKTFIYLSTTLDDALQN